MTARPYRLNQYARSILPVSVSSLRTLALLRICGGMTLSGPKACRGSTKDARILPAFLHSPAGGQLHVGQNGIEMRTPHRRGQRIVDPKRHLAWRSIRCVMRSVIGIIAEQFAFSGEDEVEMDWLSKSQIGAVTSACSGCVRDLRE